MKNNGQLERFDHILHLYTTKVDKYSIQRAFLSSKGEDEKAVYITTESPETVNQRLNLTNIEVKVIKPEQIRDLMGNRSKLRVVNDAGSIIASGRLNNEIEEREAQIRDLSKTHVVHCLCTYDVLKLDRDMLRQLAMLHNQRQLTTSDLTVISGDLFDRSKLSPDSLNKTVKKNLEIIVLALIKRSPMCGTDIIQLVHKKFNILLSPGSIYPLLHTLEESGLITSKKDGKAKIYSMIEGSELKIQELVDEQVHARKFLEQFLQQEISVEGR